MKLLFSSLFAAAAAAAAAATAAAAAAGAAHTPELSGDKLAELMQLSLPEIEQRMKIIFELVDTNKDDEIDEQEALEWSQKLKDAMHRHQVKQEFLSIDKDNDNKITLEELEVTYTDGADAANQEAHKEEVRKRFAAVDKDKSGNLSLEEVTMLMDPGKDPVLMQIEVDEIMAAQDKDKDGAISLDEFLQNEGGSLTDAEREELKREFEGYDTNKNNKIDIDELKEVIANPHAADLQQLLQQLQQQMDSSNKIKKENYLINYQSLAVSMLTDNGELLRFPEEYEGIDLPFKGISEGIQEDEDPLKHDEL